MKKEKGKGRNLFSGASETIENSEKAAEKLFQAIQRAERIVDELLRMTKRRKRISKKGDA